jgi:hypothetical protein
MILDDINISVELMLMIYTIINRFGITPTVEYLPGENKSKITLVIPQSVLEERKQEAKALFAFVYYNDNVKIKAIVDNKELTNEEKHKKLISFYNRSNKIRALVKVKSKVF